MNFEPSKRQQKGNTPIEISVYTLACVQVAALKRTLHSFLFMLCSMLSNDIGHFILRSNDICIRVLRVCFCVMNLSII